MSRLRQITEATAIPISLAITIMGGVAWLTTIYNQGNANAAALTALQDDRKAKREEYVQTIGKMNDALSSIDQRLSDRKSVV